MDGIVYCPYADCGEELEQNEYGELPYLCEVCTKPTGRGPLRICPECNSERHRLRSGNLVNVCRDCPYNYLTGATVTSHPVLPVSDLSIDTMVGMATQPEESLSLDLAKFDATCEAVDEDGQLDFSKMEKLKSIYTNKKSNEPQMCDKKDNLYHLVAGETIDDDFAGEKDLLSSKRSPGTSLETGVGEQPEDSLSLDISLANITPGTEDKDQQTPIHKMARADKVPFNLKLDGSYRSASADVQCSMRSLITFREGDEDAIDMEFHFGNLRNALQGFEEYPMLVVAISGKFRTGKSFLVNLMITYLKLRSEKTQSSKWKDSGIPIHGVNWARGEKTVTEGIHFWEPIVFKKHDGNEIAVLFVDCQGTGDTNQAGRNLDAVIYYIGLQLSNLQIVNVMRQVDTEDLDRLDTVLEFGYKKEANGSGPFLRNLIFLVRDWNHDDAFGKKSGSFVTQFQESKASVTKEAAESIGKAFQSVIEYRLPEPSKKVKKSSDTSGLRVAASDLDEEFQTEVEKLFESVFEKDEHSHLEKGARIIQRLEELEKIETRKLKLPSGKESIDEEKAFLAYEEAKAKLLVLLKDVDELIVKEDVTTDEVGDKLESVRAIILEEFNKAYGKSEQMRQESKAYLKYDDHLKGTYENYKNLKEAQLSKASLERKLRNAVDEPEKSKLHDRLYIAARECEVKIEQIDVRIEIDRINGRSILYGAAVLALFVGTLPNLAGGVVAAATFAKTGDVVAAATAGNEAKRIATGLKFLLSLYCRN